MTRPPVVCAVDVGSTAIKAAIYTHGLEVLGQAVTGLPLHRSEVIAEVDPDALWRTVATTIRSSIRQAERQPTAIVFAAQMAGQCLMDAKNRPIGPILMGLDRRHDPHAGPIRDSRQIARLAWWTHNRPHDLLAARRFGGLKEYLLWRATHSWVTDPASASVSGFYHPGTQTWTPPVSIDDVQLPAILPSDHTIGTLTPDAARDLHLTTDTAVLCGIGDGPASSLAAGAVGHGRLCLTLGTTSVARLLLNANTADAIPAPTPTTFVQHVHAGWYCTGTRAEQDINLTDLVECWNIEEIRVIGGRSTPTTLQHIAARTHRRTCTTAATDGTLGAALLALHPRTWLDAATDLPIVTDVPPTVRTPCQS